MKKQYYGKTRVAVGGKSTEGDKKSGSEDEEEDELDSEVVVPPAVDSSGNLFMPKNRNNCNLEPVCFWSMPVLFYKELVSSYNLQAIVRCERSRWRCCQGMHRPSPAESWLLPFKILGPKGPIKIAEGASHPEPPCPNNNNKGPRGFPMVASKERYVGICWSDEHVTGLRTELVKYVIKLFKSLCLNLIIEAF